MNIVSNMLILVIISPHGGRVLIRQQPRSSRHQNLCRCFFVTRKKLELEDSRVTVQQRWTILTSVFTGV